MARFAPHPPPPNQRSRATQLHSKLGLPLDRSLSARLPRLLRRLDPPQASRALGARAHKQILESERKDHERFVPWKRVIVLDSDADAVRVGKEAAIDKVKGRLDQVERAMAGERGISVDELVKKSLKGRRPGRRTGRQQEGSGAGAAKSVAEQDELQ